jgi:hypothetical protein
MRDLTALKSLRVQSKSRILHYCCYPAVEPWWNDLAGNRLSEFPRHIMHLTTMHEINLASNRIQEIPREFLFNNMAMTIKRMYLQNNFLVQVLGLLKLDCYLVRTVKYCHGAVFVGIIPQIPLGLHWMSAITELRLDNNPSLRSPPQTVTLGGVSSIMAYSAVRSRNIRHLIDHALKYQVGMPWKSGILATCQWSPCVVLFPIQFCILQSRLTPKAEKVLTGGVGLLAQHDLDEFDDNV